MADTSVLEPCCFCSTTIGPNDSWAVSNNLRVAHLGCLLGSSEPAHTWMTINLEERAT